MKIKPYYIIIVLIVVAGLIALYFFVQKMGKGSLQITASDSNATINLYDSLTNKPTKLGTGSAMTDLKPGDYTVEAVSGEEATRQVVTVAENQSASVTLQLAAVRQASVITSYTAKDVLPTPDGVSFLNIPDSSVLHYYGAEEARLITRDTYPATDVYWLSPSSFVYTSGDQTYNLFKDGVITPLNFSDPSSHQRLSPDAFAINQKGQVVFGSKATLYFVDSVLSPVPRAIKTGLDIKSGPPDIQLSGTGLTAITYTPSGGVDSSQPTTIPGAVILDPAGKAVNINVPDNKISALRWSTDGAAFAYSTATGTYTYNMTSKKVTTLTTLTGTIASTVAWADDTQAVYTDTQSVWRFNSVTGVSQKLFTNPGSLSLSSPFVVDRTSLYFAIAPSGGYGSVGAIYSASLN